MTYKLARQDLYRHFEANGWSMSRPELKIPHATSPCGRLRLWFRPQAIRYTLSWGPRGHQHHEHGNARSVSYDLDIRQHTPGMIQSFLVGRMPASVAWE